MVDKPICPKCNAPMREGCDGQGYILVTKEADPDRPWFNPEHVQQCINLYARQLKAHLGPELALVQHVTSSPLLELGSEGWDLTRYNLFINECPWKNLLPHLKWALGKRRPGFNPLLFFSLITTDEQLKTVWVGDSSYRSKSIETRDTVKTYNSLSDLLSDRDLVIIKLGYFGQRNKAAAGLLKEALLFRESLNKPTWLVLEPDKDWSVSYSPDVAQYVKSNFKFVQIEPTADPKVESPAGIVIDDDEEDDEEAERVMSEIAAQWPGPGDEGGSSGGGPGFLDEGPLGGSRR